MGGTVYGMSMALHDTRRSIPYRPLHECRLSEYLVPANRASGGIDVLLVDKDDTLVDPIGVKSLGEIGPTA